MWDSQERRAWIAGNVRADEALRRAGGIGMRGRLALEAVERRRRPHPDSEDDGAD